MSSLMSGDKESPSTPKSSKKRKAAVQVPEASTKKRKHGKKENGMSASQETTISIIEAKKEKKRKREGKKTKKAELQETDEGAPKAQRTEDIDIPDAIAEPDTLSQQIEASGGLVTNSMHLEDAEDAIEYTDTTLLQSHKPSCFYEKRLSLQLPIPAISLKSPTQSLLSLHLAPLLLTYFPPADGIVLSFSNPVLSARPSHDVNLPLHPPKSGDIPRYPPGETFARCADGYGVCWVWLTATVLVFKPETGDELKGWTNVTSEGFIGLVSYNYFQAAVGNTRIPKSWMWDGPTRESNRNKRKTKIGRLRDESSVNGSQETLVNSQGTSYGADFNEGAIGSFTDADGKVISSIQTFKVVDTEMVPGHEKDRWTLQIEGSLLSPEDESAVLSEQRQRFEQLHNRSRSRSKTPGFGSGATPIMSGGLEIDRISGSPS